MSEVTKNYDNIQMVIEGLQKNGIYDKRCEECPVHAFCWTCPESVETVKNTNALLSQCKLLYSVLMKRI